MVVAYILVREDLVVGGVVGPLPLRHFVVDGRDVEDVAERQTQRCRQSTPPRVNRIYDISRVQYDTRRYFHVRSKADTSQLNLPHGTATTKKCKKEKVKTDMLRSNSKSLGNHVVGPEGETERLQWEGFTENGGFKPGMKE